MDNLIKTYLEKINKVCSDVSIDETDKRKLDIYTDINWSGKNKKEYREKEKHIYNFSIDNDLFLLKSWCDISGYDYWVKQQEEDNYVSIDIHLKKDLIDFTEQELDVLIKTLDEAQDDLITFLM